MKKDILFLISVFMIEVMGGCHSISCQSIKGQAEQIIDTVEIYDHEGFIKFSISTEKVKENIKHEIKIYTEYVLEKMIMDVLVENDTIRLIKKQELKFSLPIMVEGSELLHDTTYVDRNIYLMGTTVHECCDNLYHLPYGKIPNLLSDLCSYLRLLKCENCFVYYKHFTDKE